MGIRRLTISDDEEDESPSPSPSPCLKQQKPSSDSEEEEWSKQRKRKLEEEDDKEMTEEAHPHEDAKPIGDAVRVSGKGKTRRKHYESFEFDGSLYVIVISFLIFIHFSC